MSELLQIMELAEKIARDAGALLMQRPSKFALDEKSGVLDFATQMDHASEKLIVTAITAARPNDGLIGDEGAERVGASGFTWIIDPIDGTVNYLYDLPGWCISIGVKDAEGYCVGVIYSPTTNSLWKAARGHGSFLNGNKIRCNEPVTLDRALLGTGFAYDRERRKTQSEFIKNLLPQIRDLRRMGACAADVSSVAAGALDGFFETGVNEWDFAASFVIASEAGAKVLARPVWNGTKYLIVVAGPTLHQALMAQIEGSDLA